MRALRPASLLVAAALALLALFGTLALALPAQAQTTTTFVSNLGQADASFTAQVNANVVRAQQFETGSNSGGYTLSEIVVNIRGAGSGTPAFALYTSTSDDKPGTKVVDLGGDSSTAGEQSFAPASATTLSASTKYIIAFYMTSGSAILQTTTSNAVDPGASPGWNINTTSLYSTDSGTSFNSFGNEIEIAVKGTAVGGGTPSTPELSVGDASATEGGTMTFPVTLSEAVTDDVTATWTASFGSNEENAAAADLASTTGTVTIGGGDTAGTFTVTAAGDSTDEHDETFTVTLSGVSSNAQLATDPTATGTITDDDDPPSLSVEFDASVSESSGFVTFPVLMTAESGKTVTVTLTASAESGDTAESPADFTAESHVLTFDPGVIRVSTTFRTVNDEIVEDDETFTVTLSNVTNAVISDATATGTITNDDTADTTCTLNTGDLWCGVVTVEAVEISGTTVGYGFATSAGALSDTGFTVGTNDYTIDAVMTGVSTLAGQLLFGLFGGSLSDADKANLVLHVDGHSDSFEVIDAGGPSPTGVYNWVSSGLDWTSTSEVTLRLREVTRATIADVAVTSTPLLTSTDGSTTHTYGVGETIELSVTFTEAVDATSDTDFVLSVSGPKRAPLLSGSGTTTLVFGYTVLAADVDANGIWIGPFDRTLAGDRNGDTQNGAITSADTGVKVNFAHSALDTLGGHRVDGGRSIVLVAVTSTPMLETDTYGADETIRFTVTFNAAVDVTGDPVYTFSLGSPGDIRNVNAAYESGTGTAELVFGYTVLSSDVDSNGIYQLGGEMDFDTVKGPVGLDADDAITFTVTSADAPLAYPVRVQRSDHKVDGSQTAGVSSDATLSGLTVTGGGSDLVTFASGTTDYTASVANDVAEVTVTAETTDSGASVAYLDGDYATITDADTGVDGHQVTLAEGDNVIKVKVTAEDANATETYTVTVSRAEADTTAPTLTRARVTTTGNSIHLFFSEDLDLTDGQTLSATAQGAFSLTVDGVEQEIPRIDRGSGAALANRLIVYPSSTITIYGGHSVVVSYDQSAAVTDAIADPAGNEVADFTTGDGGVPAVTNDSTATCTLNTGDLWCGVVTVADLGSGAYGFFFPAGTQVGDLTDNSGDRIFRIGTASHAVYRVAASSFGLSFGVTRTTADNVQSPGLHDDDRARLHLHVDGHSASFAFSDAVIRGSIGYEWSGASLDWSSTGSVTVRLREATPPDAPTNFTATVGDTQVALGWDAAASDSGVTGHEFRYKTDGD